MRKTWLAVLVLAGLGVAVEARADLTITGTTSGKALVFSGEGQSVTYVKGHRLRIDSTMKDTKTSMVIDLDAQQFTTINHKKREAEVVDMSAVREKIQGITDSQVTVEFTPTGQKKQIAGQTCDEFSLRIRVPMSEAQMNLVLIMSGPVWIAKQSPGRDDYAAFYRYAADNGLFFIDPRAAKAQPGNAKGWAAAYRKFAEVGIAYESSLTISLDTPDGSGAGMLGGLMKSLGGNSTMTTVVSNVSTDPVGDETFAIPADYKVKTSK